MKLSKTDIIDLRKTIEEEINKADLPRGARIKIDNKLLDTLLFEEFVVSNKPYDVAKIPVWSGEFLRHIDLSDIDFTNVSWELGNYNRTHLGYVDGPFVDNRYPKDLAPFLDKFDCRDKRIYFGHTNAVIDLNQSYEAKKHLAICLSNCDFSGVVFKDIDPELVGEVRIYSSDVSDSNLNIPKTVGIAAVSSNLKNIDLYGRKVIFNTHFKKDVDSLGDCNLRNTGVNIIITPREWNKSDKREELVNDLRDYLAYDWVGCFINGKLIESPEDREHARQALKDKYDTYRTAIKSLTISDIANQSKKLIKTDKKSEC